MSPGLISRVVVADKIAAIRGASSNVWIKPRHGRLDAIRRSLNGRAAPQVSRTVRWIKSGYDHDETD